MPGQKQNNCGQSLDAALPCGHAFVRPKLTATVYVPDSLNRPPALGQERIVSRQKMKDKNTRIPKCVTFTCKTTIKRPATSVVGQLYSLF